ncbi:probable 39S ribosomal protein L24, mitochondrial isoform X2 [Varroa jacobsoni]|nr:probable 39S ribosomal protein L24, mitochondrial isoform X2 [Varroa destructor]XP_022654245.1 probable 39S ribosomal protein L24, mitochondrial isoform X2 [Varroa destructor]XP_022686596.1 probable 39S ribosomal protein L24, mitochondrial isoform X2 [Varroa jacobsoni]XP_022686597.1 probable 39S ribosomal protein L24, mitochondrial isoform X2 [Varroa jacobsoni]
MRLSHILLTASKLPKDYANLPKSYVKRAMAQVEWRTPNGRQFRRAVVQKPWWAFRYTMNRPWTNEFMTDNPPGVAARPIPVQVMKRTFFRGDRVEVMVGDDKGKQGTVNYIVPERNWVTVEGLNTELKEEPRGMGKVQYRREELPLLMGTQVKLVDPVDEKATDVEWRYTESGERVRVSVRTGRIIPIPLTAYETIDYKSRATYVDKAKDTSATELEKITFVPKLATFEMDIMEQHGIQDDRVPHRTFWY